MGQFVPHQADFNAANSQHRPKRYLAYSHTDNASIHLRRCNKGGNDGSLQHGAIFFEDYVGL